jgi:hypothetical protein
MSASRFGTEMLLSRIEIALKQKTCHKGRIPVFHVANHQLTNWSDIMDGLRQAGIQFSAVPPHDWVENVRRSPGDVEADPTKGMLAMWSKAVSDTSCQRCTVRLTLTIRTSVRYARNECPSRTGENKTCNERIGRTCQLSTDIPKADRKNGSSLASFRFPTSIM